MRWLVLLLALAACERKSPEETPRQPRPARSDAGFDLDEVRKQIDQLEADGKPEAARDLAKQVVDQLRPRKQTALRELTGALETYGRLLQFTGAWPDAEAVLNEALASRAVDASLRATLLYDLGAVHAHQRRNVLAATELEEALRLSEEIYGTGSAEALRTSEVLAGVYDYLGEYAKAEPLFRRAVAFYEANGDNGELGRALTNVALNLEYQARDDDAMRLYKHALATFAATTGSQRHGLAAAYGGTGAILLRRHDLREAEAAYRKALAARIDELGDRHPFVAMDLHNLAVVLKQRGRIAEALHTCERAEALRRELLESTHPHRVETEQLCADLRTR